VKETANTDLLKNKYRLDRKIAQGGMSSVYLCTNLELGSKWVAKHIDDRYSDFIYEEEILKRLNHISLPKIIDICKEESGIYIIESYIEGISLEGMLQRAGALTLEKIIDYSLQLCEVLAYLHNLRPKAIIHRDLKPSNIIITEYDKLVLIDFGISVELGEEGCGIKAGTNAYSAPEQLISSGKSDTTADIYSLGIVLHQMLTGQLPGKISLQECRKPSIIYERLLQLSERCSRFQPDERYRKIEDVRRILLQIRNQNILIREKNRVKRKVVIILICLLSAINYGCLLFYMVYKSG